MTTKRLAKLSTLILTIALASVALAQDFDLSWHTIDGGGEMSSTGGDFELSGTIGQSDARNNPEPMTGGDYKLTGGFWVIPECPPVPADYDRDGDVDQADYLIFVACTSGPAVPHDRDFDEDTDVDQADFAVFQRCLSGEDKPADPTCAD